MKAKNKRKKISTIQKPEEIVIHTARLQSKRSKLLTFNFSVLTLSFLLPVLIQSIVFILHKVFPFGTESIIASDFFHQYYPFINDLWHRSRDGTLGIWSWTLGGGADYLPVIAYYLASPFNLLALLFPHSWLRELVTLSLLFKLGFAGLFMAYYLKQRFRQERIALPFFSSLYALCGFTLGYYWNIIWFDTFALFPLVMLGFDVFMREGKYKLYILSLGLSMFFNYYICFFVCIFIAISFFAQCIILKLDLRTFLRKLGLIAGFSAIAIGITALLVVPALKAMMNTSHVGSGFTEDYYLLYFNIFDLLGNFIAFTPPTVLEGMPNHYSGMISVLLCGIFLYSKKIPLREKIVFIATLTFLIFGNNFNILYWILNGFRYPNQIPFRNTFIISFLVIMATYRAFLVRNENDKREYIAMGIIAVIFLVSALLGLQETKHVIASAALSAGYIGLLFFSSETKNARVKMVIKTAFFLLIILEIVVTSHAGVTRRGTIPRNNFPDRNQQVQKLLTTRQEPVNDFFRTEQAYRLSFNDPAMYNYRGISFFSASAQNSVNRFMNGLGIAGIRDGNRFIYTETTPLTNAFLNIRYMISRRGRASDPDVYWQINDINGDSLLLENRYYLPFGFMVNDTLADYTHLEHPFLSQNDIFHRATGLDGDIFTVTDLGNHDIDARRGADDLLRLYMVWQHEASYDGMYYLFIDYGSQSLRSSIEVFHETTRLNVIEVLSRHIVTLGRFSKGDNIMIRLVRWLTVNDILPQTYEELLEFDEAMEERPVLYIGSLDSALFDQGYNILASEPLEITEFKSTRIKGHVTSSRGGLLYTSLPDDGNWRAYANGVETGIILIDNAMAAIRLPPGTHEIEFRYRNRALTAGIFVSLLSLFVFAGLILLERRRKEKRE